MRIKRVLIVLLIVVTVMLCIGAVLKGNIESSLERLSMTAVPDINLGSLQDGEYTGSYKVFPVAVKVKVTVKDHRITDIELLEHRNGKGAAAEAVTAKVLEAQTLGVDTISGATYSSKVILNAISNALNN